MKKYETPTMEIVNMLTEQTVLSASQITENDGLTLGINGYGDEAEW